MLVGHSMGGMTIMAFAELLPGAVRRPGGRAPVLMATSGGLIAETKLVAPALLGRVGAPLLLMVSNATRYGGTVIDRARQVDVRTGLAAHPQVRLRHPRAQPGAGVLRGDDELAAPRPTR